MVNRLVPRCKCFSQQDAFFCVFVLFVILISWRNLEADLVDETVKKSTENAEIQQIEEPLEMEGTQKEKEILPAPSKYRSSLTTEPNWRVLEPFQQSIAEEEFVGLLDQIYGAEDCNWRALIELNADSAQIRMAGDRAELWYRFEFGQRELSATERGFRLPSELEKTSQDQPLAGLRIALDPGHIGGEFSKMEGRWFVVDNGDPVEEGVMSLLVALRLGELLENLGASVDILRLHTAPVTCLRPEDLQIWLRSWYQELGIEVSDALFEQKSRLLFYRVAEIRRRADLLFQRKADPVDLTICLHFNAEEWGDPQQPNLVKQSHLHVLVNGCYAISELQQDDQRVEMLWRLLARTHEVEIPLAEAISRHCAEMMRLPAFVYTGSNARSVSDSEYVWARNLLANRIYPSPVIYMEPYVMNSNLDYRRIQAGEYEGTREFDGVERINIFAEYAQGVVAGIVEYYTENRQFYRENEPQLRQ